MKTLIWTLFALLTLLWTGLAVVSASLTDWLLGLIQSGTSMSGQLQSLAVPAWLQVWIDPTWFASVAQMLQPMLVSMGQLLPSAQTLSTMVAVVVWGIWGLGALFMLAAAVGAHWFLGRRRT
jgi:hypothetical protein